MALTRVITSDGFVTEKVDVHQNALLGNYDKAGKYIISDKIIKELMSMKKVKKSTYNNSMFCVSNNLGIGELVFEIHYASKVRNGIASSEIFLLENVYKVNGYYSNTLRTKIGEFEESVKNYIDKSYKYYNISLVDDEDDDGREERVDFKEIPYPYIIAKKQYELAMFRNIEGNIYDAYEDFFNEKMLKLKEQNTEFSKAVLEVYANDLKDLKDRFLTTDEDNNYKAQNEILDKAVENTLDTAVATKADVEAYKESIKSEIVELAELYEKEVASNEKHVKKQMQKESYENVQELKDNIDEHNLQIEEDKEAKLAFIDLEIKPEVEANKNKSVHKEKQESEIVKQIKADIIEEIKDKHSKQIDELEVKHVKETKDVVAKTEKQVANKFEKDIKAKDEKISALEDKQRASTAIFDIEPETKPFEEKRQTDKSMVDLEPKVEIGKAKEDVLGKDDISKNDKSQKNLDQNIKGLSGLASKISALKKTREDKKEKIVLTEASTPDEQYNPTTSVSDAFKDAMENGSENESDEIIVIDKKDKENNTVELVGVEERYIPVSNGATSSKDNDTNGATHQTEDDFIYVSETKGNTVELENMSTTYKNVPNGNTRGEGRDRSDDHVM